MFLAGVAVAAAITFAVVFDDYDGDDSARGESVTTSRSIGGDSSEFSLSDGGLTVKASWRGDIELNEAGDMIVAVDDVLAIDLFEDDDHQRVVLERDGKRLQSTYELNGDEWAPGDETDAKIQDVTLRFLRASAFKADARVKAIIDTTGDVDAVMEEIEQLNSDYAIRRYIGALVSREELEPDNIIALLTMVERVDGDYDIAQTLSAIADYQDLGKVKNAFLSVAGNIDSDYDKRRVLIALAGHRLTDDASEAALALLGAIDGDYDLRMGAEALLGNAGFSDRYASQLVTLVAEEVDGDYELRLILAKASSRLADDEVLEVWLNAFDDMDSDYEKRVLIEKAAANADDAVKTRLRQAALSISSDRDRTRALEALK